ncbi:hypothetical protein [Prescottella equi]|uniref:hypothetical protein n=1 Tax=Rhodococcus hoagii TaxID=43767 RepID=UPI001C78E9D2|nr:hypothetical protein [Prescottella equi]BCN46696.1 hypothetical protein RE9414_49760 [Prescottella equi]
MAEERFDTNVQIPKSASRALYEIARALGTSRDHTARQLLLTYIDRNTDTPEDERLTHISTVMRHPLPRRERDAADDLVRLRLRLPAGTTDAIRELAFRVPGQAKLRGHRDYQSRLLTDAVMTSIARSCQELGLDPITDQVLENVYPLIRQRAARGLWQLAVTATRSKAEKRVLAAAEFYFEQREKVKARTGSEIKAHYLENVAAILAMASPGEDEAVWHHEHRFVMVQTLAADILDTRSGKNPALMEQALYDQDGEDWKNLAASLVNIPFLKLTAESLTDQRSSILLAGSLEARGGATVWRAQRSIALSDIPVWLSASGRSTSERTHVVKPPDLVLRLPTEWQPMFIPGSSLPPQWSEHVAAHRVLHFDLGNTQMLWPTLDEQYQPVPNLQPALAALLDLTKDPREIAEILLLELIPASSAAAAGWGARGANTDQDPSSSDYPSQESKSNVWPPEGEGTDSDDDPFSFSLTPEPATKPAPRVGKTTVATVTDTEVDVTWMDDVPPLPKIRKKPESNDAEDTVDVEENHKDLWQLSDATIDISILVFVPAAAALRLGFIDKSHATRLIEEARVNTTIRMNAALVHARRDCEPEECADLENKMGSPTQFGRLAQKLGVKFREARPLWCWPVVSLADEVAADTSPDRLRWLAAHLHSVYTRELERSMELAGQEAARRFVSRH